jgi:hypothetical protein
MKLVINDFGAVEVGHVSVVGVDGVHGGVFCDPSMYSLPALPWWSYSSPSESSST